MSASKQHACCSLCIQPLPHPNTNLISTLEVIFTRSVTIYEIHEKSTGIPTTQNFFKFSWLIFQLSPFIFLTLRPLEVNSNYYGGGKKCSVRWQMLFYLVCSQNTAAEFLTARPLYHLSWSSGLLIMQYSQCLSVWMIHSGFRLQSQTTCSRREMPSSNQVRGYQTHSVVLFILWSFHYFLMRSQQKVAKIPQLDSLRLPSYPHVTTREPLNGYSWWLLASGTCR